MKQVKYSGVTITQYAIIIALVALVLVPILFIFGQTINASLTSFSKGFGISDSSIGSVQNSNQPQPDNQNSAPQVSNQIGTIDNPAKQCNNKTCTINYGKFTLKGIPSDYDSYLKSSGSSGTSELLLSLLDQIIAQSENLDTNADINLLKDLSNSGHKVALTQKALETNAEDLLKDPTQLVTTAFIVPAEELDSIKLFWFNSDLDKVNQSLKNSTNPDDQKILAIVNTLGEEINALSKNMTKVANDIPTGYEVPADVVEKILQPDASNITNLNSAIICATGDGEDTGEKCN